MIRTGGNFVPFLTSPISAVFLGIAMMVLVTYMLKPIWNKKKAGK